MSAKIVNMANPDEDETLCATVEEARETLAAMVERFKSPRTGFLFIIFMIQAPRCGGAKAMKREVRIHAVLISLL